MANFFEIDFLEVHTSKSGDAIAIRYELDEVQYVHVVDGGYSSTGPALVKHIEEFYDVNFVDHVVASHPDKDHAEGLISILDSFDVGVLWMLCPWHYSAELLSGFDTYNSVERLRSKLKQLYPYLAALEDKAIARNIEIREAFQGAQIGAFTVMSPSKDRYLQLILDAERTPISTAKAQAGMLDAAMRVLYETARKAVNFVRMAWGEEVFSTDPVSCENEMSIVQYARLNELSLLLTADTGPAGLRETIDYAPSVGLTLPGIDRFQVPHHGSRRNLTSELLDELLGSKLETQPQAGTNSRFTAFVSAASDDTDHPRKVVVRALHHRGARIVTTESGTIRTSMAAPAREGWSAATPMPYPEEQEE